MVEAQGPAAAPEHGRMVTITVDSVQRQIRRGRQSVAEIKTVGGVPAAYQLEEVVDGQLVALPDDGALVIKGGEVFVSHPRSGGSS